jgi:SulP family sulfate permease
VVIYDISGPMFFGAAQRAMATLGIVDRARAVIIRMEGVPVMDATGLVALESAITELHKRGAQVYLIGPQAQPRQLLTNAGLVEKAGKLMFRDGLDEALSELAPA